MAEQKLDSRVMASVASYQRKSYALDVDLRWVTLYYQCETFAIHCEGG